MGLSETERGGGKASEVLYATRCGRKKKREYQKLGFLASW